MKNLTIKALVLSLAVLFVSNSKCSADYTHISDKFMIKCSQCSGSCTHHISDKFLITCGVVAATAIVGAIGYTGREVAKYVSSFCQKIKKKKQEVSEHKEDLDELSEGSEDKDVQVQESVPAV